MTSLQTSLKQIPANAGYYIPLADCRTTFYANSGTNAAPTFVSGLSTLSTAGARISTLIATAGAGVLRDHGLTLTSASRVFRKVQLLISSNSLVNGGTDGVGGTSYEAVAANQEPYITGFIELPGTGGYSTGTGSFTPVARLG
jgi:hypothetical protein